jgi:hypothetical protein
MEELDIIRAAGAIIGRSSSGRPEVVRCFREKAVSKRTPLYRAAGFFMGGLHAKAKATGVVFTLA